VKPSEPGQAESRRGPLLDLLDMRPSVVGRGRVQVEYIVGKDHLRSMGIAHGGILATLLDTALGLSASTVAPPGMDVVTAQLNVNYIRPAWNGERLVAQAEVKHGGRKTAVAWAEVRTDDGSLVASGSATLFFIPARDLVRDETLS
jgi:acyl-CoA thioesterase